MRAHRTRQLDSSSPADPPPRPPMNTPDHLRFFVRLVGAALFVAVLTGLGTATGGASRSQIGSVTYVSEGAAINGRAKGPAGEPETPWSKTIYPLYAGDTVSVNTAGAAVDFKFKQAKQQIICSIRGHGSVTLM